MKRFDGSAICLVFIGSVIALLTGGGSVNADFTYEPPMNLGPTVGGEGKDNAQSLVVNGKILDQYLNANGQGYTVIRVWGSYYEMGYAHAHLIGDLIVETVNQTKALLGTTGYENTRHVMAQSVWIPSAIEDELDGMADSLAETHPNASIDKIDLKVVNTQGDWAFACRSHICWGRYVAEPIKTLATRRLDFPTTIPIANCHVLCSRDPNDGSPRWVNMAWPGFVVLSAGINEHGTLAVVQDYQSFNADLSPDRMSRSVASRYALTFPTGSDVSTHLIDVFTELQKYEIMTGSFIAHYAPEGHGGIMTCHPHRTGPDFYNVRTPQEAWHHGEAMITTNAWTDGTYTPADEDFRADAYYNDESPKTHENHWDLVASGATGSLLNLHMLSVAYRGPEDMTIWADGRLDDDSRTPRLEYEWSALFDLYDRAYDVNRDGIVDIKDLLILIEYWGQDEPTVDIAPPPSGDGVVDGKDLEAFMDHWGQIVADPTLIAHWPLDETQGDIAYDSVSVHDGILCGNPVWQPDGGVVTGALQFDGFGDYVSTEPILNPASRTFSVTAWIKGGAPGQVILSQTNRTGWLRVDSTEGYLMTGLKLDRTTTPLLSQTCITDGTWHGIGFVWDGSYRHLYVDGTEVATDASPISGLASAEGGLYFGAGGTLAPGSFFSGLIDDIRIYGQAFNSEEIAPRAQ